MLISSSLTSNKTSTAQLHKTLNDSILNINIFLLISKTVVSYWRFLSYSMLSSFWNTRREVTGRGQISFHGNSLWGWWWRRVSEDKKCQVQSCQLAGWNPEGLISKARSSSDHENNGGRYAVIQRAAGWTGQREPDTHRKHREVPHGCPEARKHGSPVTLIQPTIWFLPNWLMSTDADEQMG